MTIWTLVKLGDMNPYTAKALDEALIIARNGGIIGNTLVVRKALTSIWLGRKASLSLVNVPFCKENDIPIARAFQDGGATLVGGLPGFSLVMDRELFSSKYDNRLLIECIVKAYQELGLPAKARLGANNVLSNDIVVREKKIAGTTIERFGDTLFFGGTITLDFDYDLARKVLRIPSEKFRDKKAKSVDEWVTSAKIELGREVGFDEAVYALKKGFEEVLQVEFDVSTSLTEAEEQILEGLQEKYRSDEWLKTGRWSPVKDYGR